MDCRRWYANEGEAFITQLESITERDEKIFSEKWKGTKYEKPFGLVDVTATCSDGQELTLPARSPWGRITELPTADRSTKKGGFKTARLLIDPVHGAIRNFELREEETQPNKWVEFGEDQVREVDLVN